MQLINGLNVMNYVINYWIVLMNCVINN